MGRSFPAEIRSSKVSPIPGSLVSLNRSALLSSFIYKPLQNKAFRKKNAPKQFVSVHYGFMLREMGLSPYFLYLQGIREIYNLMYNTRTYCFFRIDLCIQKRSYIIHFRLKGLIFPLEFWINQQFFCQFLKITHVFPFPFLLDNLSDILSDILKPSLIRIVVSRYVLSSSVSNSGVGEPLIFRTRSILDIPVACFSDSSIC